MSTPHTAVELDHDGQLLVAEFVDDLSRLNAVRTSVEGFAEYDPEGHFKTADETADDATFDDTTVGLAVREQSETTTATLATLKAALTRADTTAADFSQIGPLDTGYITFGGGVPVGGFARLTIRSDGSYAFNGHFHVSGAGRWRVQLAWVIVDANGTAYTFTIAGTVNGTFYPGSRDFDWSRTGTNPAIARGWPAIARGWRYRWSARVNFDVLAVLNSVISALKTAGTFIAAVVAIV
jgi:hypothetical protein